MPCPLPTTPTCRCRLDVSTLRLYKSRHMPWYRHMPADIRLVYAEYTKHACKLLTMTTYAWQACWQHVAFSWSGILPAMSKCNRQNDCLHLCCWVIWHAEHAALLASGKKACLQQVTAALCVFFGFLTDASANCFCRVPTRCA